MNNTFLIDTHIFLWWMRNDKHLHKEIQIILENPENTILLSTISIWELIIKKAKKKVRLPKNWKITLGKSQFQLLNISIEHVLTLETLPLYHNDPFDRMLIAQALAEKCTLVTTDVKMKKYDVPILE